MFTWRYHILPLAARTSSRSPWGSCSASRFPRGVGRDESSKRPSATGSDRICRDANESLDFANRRKRETAEALIESAYPALMDRRLEGRRFTVVFLGPVQGDVPRGDRADPRRQPAPAAQAS